MTRFGAGVAVAAAVVIAAFILACGTSEPVGPPAVGVAITPTPTPTPTPPPTPTPTPDCGLTFVPFVRIHAIAPASSGSGNGDRLVVGDMTRASYDQMWALPLPSSSNQRFCRDVTLGPG